MRKILESDLAGMADRITAIRLVPIDEEFSKFTLQFQFGKSGSAVAYNTRGGLRIFTAKIAFQYVREHLNAKEVTVILEVGGKGK